MNRVSCVRALLWVASAALCGCYGITFADEPLNERLPDDFKNRVLWPETDIWKYNLGELAGTFVTKTAHDGRWRRGKRAVRPDYVPTVKVKKDQVVYHSKIDRRAAAQGSYLAFAASLAEEQKAEIEIKDVAEVLIPDADLPWDEIDAQASAIPDRTPDEFYYIQGLVLASITMEDLVKIEANASAVLGNTTGIEGEVYNSRNDFSQDYRISMALIDLKEVKRRLKSEGDEVRRLWRPETGDAGKLREFVLSCRPDKSFEIPELER